MYIESIELKNDARIYSGMQLDEIKFKLNQKNMLNLLYGDNGTGKSSLLGSLSPFPNEVIRKGLKGRKKIVYKKKKSKIEIVHEYLPKKSKGKEGHTCKHYIRKIKNGQKIELNENGNLDSFIQCVKDELGIDPVTLKLIQLGNNMNDIISKQPSMRKSFMSSFVADIEEYLKKEKIASSNLKTINDLLNNYAIQMKKLGNKDDLMDSLIFLEKEISKYTEEKNSLDKEIIISNNYIDEFNNIKSKNKEYYDKYRNIQNLKVSYNIKDLDLNKINDDINNLEKTELALNHYISMDNLRKENLNEKISKIESEISEKRNSINLMELMDDSDISNEEIKKAKKTLQSLKGRMKFTEEYKDFILENEPNIKLLESIFNNANEKVNNLLSKVTDKSEENFKNSTELLIDFDKKYKAVNNEIIKTITNIKILNEKKYNLVNPPKEDCWNICPLLKNQMPLRDLNKNLDNENQYYKSLKDQLIYVEEKIENLKIIEEINSVISQTAFDIKNNSKVFSLLINKDYVINIPLIDFEYSKINEFLMKNVICDNILFNLSEFDMINNDLNTCKMYKQTSEFLSKVEEIQKNNSEYNNLKEKIKQLTEEKDNYSLEINNLEKRINENKSSLNITESKLFNLINMKNSIKDLENVDLIETKAKEYEKDLTKYEEVNSKLIDLNSRLKDINSELNELNTKREIISSNLQEIKKLEKTKSVLDEYYQDCKMVRDSLSTNKGIPTVKIDAYMQQIRLRANEILSGCFDDETFEFDKFVINSKEFRMPIINNGDGVEDISKCSSGQKALGMLAMSLAIYERTGTKYNILGLDEVDGQLDEHKRRKFFNIVKDKTAELGISQVIAISHNKAFADVDANFIMFKGAEIDSINNQKNIIFKA